MQFRWFFNAVIIVVIFSFLISLQGCSYFETSDTADMNVPPIANSISSHSDIVLPSDLEWDSTKSMAINTDSFKGGLYHYSGRPNVSWCQFANAIFEQTECTTIASPIPTTEYPTPAIRPLNNRLDCGVTQATFRIARPFWRDGLEEILRDLEDKDDRA